MMKKYHIAYFYWKTNQFSGFGSTTITADADEDIYTEECLKEIRQSVINKNDFDGCVILNIIPLNA